MTKLSVDGQNLVVTVEGADKIWALKSHLTIPLGHIESCRYEPELARGWYHGLKMPGTNLPGVITAGSFYKSGNKVFWDVHHPDKTVVLKLHDESYSQLVIEVDDPLATIGLVTDAIKRV